MLATATAFAALAALIHVVIFVMESILFGNERVWREFAASAEAARHMQPFAFNQGFYNLFLAAGAATGAWWVHVDAYEQAGTALLGFACGSMLLAGVVLAASNRAFARAAAVQAGPPLAALVALALA